MDHGLLCRYEPILSLMHGKPMKAQEAMNSGIMMHLDLRCFQIELYPLLMRLF
jgi:hypothetical protein